MTVATGMMMPVDPRYGAEVLRGIRELPGAGDLAGDPRA